MMVQPVQTDEQLVQSVNTLLRINPQASRTYLMSELRVGKERLERLHSQGLIKLPPPMSTSTSGKRGALSNNKGWRDRSKATIAYGKKAKQ